MRLHRFFIGVPLNGTVTVGDDALCHQWHRVLRLETGDKLIALDGAGNEADAEFAELGPKKAVLRVGPSRRSTGEPDSDVTLYCSVLKRENMEWVVQKAVETGAKRIVPVLAARTVKMGLKMDRLRAIAKEAAEQSGRGIVPEVAEPVPFAEALAAAEGERIFLDFGGDAAWAKPCAACSCWIGPEGGWTPEERKAAEAAGCVIGSLGAQSLRAETAAVVASYLAVHAG